MPPVLGTATGWFHYAALIVLLGAVAARALVLPRVARASDGGEVASRLRPLAARMALLGAALLVVATGVVFLRQLLDFRDPFVPWQEDADLLLNGTAWGATWTRAAVGSLATLVVFAWVARAAGRGADASAAWWTGGLLAAALGAFPAFTGHASGAGPLRPLTLAADTLHVWAAGTWIGGLAFVLHAERRWRARATGEPSEVTASTGAAPAQTRSALPHLVPAFSPLALGSAATLVATGVLAGGIHLGGLAPLATTPYGWALVLKLALVGVMAGLGWWNWKRLTPRLGEAGGPAALGRAATLELLVAQVVLLVTAVLVRIPPPSG